MTGRLALRALMVLAPTAAMACGWVAGLSAGWLVAMVAAASLWAGVRPDGAGLLVASLLVVLGWGLGVEDQAHPIVILAACCLFAGHLAGVLAGYGPPELPIGGAVVRLWLRRTAVAVVTAIPAWIAIELAGRSGAVPGMWQLGLGLVVALGIGASVLAGRRASAT